MIVELSGTKRREATKKNMERDRGGGGGEKKSVWRMNRVLFSLLLLFFGKIVSYLYTSTVHQVPVRIHSTINSAAVLLL